MKQDIFYDTLKALKKRPHLKRNLKKFAAVGALGLFICFGLLVWGSLSALNFVTSKANLALHSPVTQKHIESLKTQALGAPNIQTLNCWGKAQSLLAVQVWLEKPALENLEALRVACLEHKT